MLRDGTFDGVLQIGDRAAFLFAARCFSLRNAVARSFGILVKRCRKQRVVLLSGVAHEHPCNCRLYSCGGRAGMANGHPSTQITLRLV